MTTEVTNDPLAIKGGQADLESKEAEKLFQEAFNATRPDRSPAVVVETPEVVEATPTKTETEVTPAVVTKTEETPSAVVTSTEVKQPVTEVDPTAWISSLPDDLKEKAKAVLDERALFKHQAESDRQRVIALNRKSMNLDRELAALRSQIQKPQDKQLAAQVAVEAVKSTAEWEQLINADPTLAKAIDDRVNKTVEARLNAAIGGLDSKTQELVSKTVAPLQASQMAARQADEMKMLLDEVPNAMDVLQSEQYKYWFDNYASEGIRQVALSSIDHRDALNVLHVYSRDLPLVINDLVSQGKMQMPPATKQQAAVTPTATTPVVDTTKADQVAKQREQKLTNAPVVQQSTPAVVPTAAVGIGGFIDLDDPNTQALFNEAYKKNQRTR